MSIRQILSAAFLAANLGAFSAAQEADTPPDVTAAMAARLMTGEEFDLVLDPDDAVLVDQFVGKLSDPDYAVREQAASELIDIGAAALTRLREVYYQMEDLEARMRIEEIVRNAYLNHHALGRHGFLGISMMGVDDATLPQALSGLGTRKAVPKEVKLPPARVGVLISEITPNSGAERAGLQEFDILIGLKGVPIEGSGPVPIRENFSALIRQHPPGSRIDLELVRGGEILVVEAVLSRTPERVARRNNVIKITEMYNTAAARFPEWWQKYFIRAEPANRDPRLTGTP